jgi:hypothetical protein
MPRVRPWTLQSTLSRNARRRSVPAAAHPPALGLCRLPTLRRPPQRWASSSAVSSMSRCCHVAGGGGLPGTRSGAAWAACGRCATASECPLTTTPSPPCPTPPAAALVMQFGALWMERSEQATGVAKAQQQPACKPPSFACSHRTRLPRCAAPPAAAAAACCTCPPPRPRMSSPRRCPLRRYAGRTCCCWGRTRWRLARSRPSCHPARLRPRRCSGSGSWLRSRLRRAVVCWCRSLPMVRLRGTASPYGPARSCLENLWGCCKT